MAEIDPPHIGDMFTAGLTVQQAAHLNQMIRANPEQPAGLWWGVLQDTATAMASARRSLHAEGGLPSPTRPARMQ